jgi:hypothetical protein
MAQGGFVWRLAVVRSFTVVGIAAAAMLAAGSAVAGADAPASETITLFRTEPFGPPDGWSATGGFADRGSWTDDSFVVRTPHSPVEFNFREVTTQTGTGGTFRIRFDSEGNNAQEQDHWAIVDGTGAYAKLRGHGSFTLAVDPDGRFRVTCTGIVANAP